MATALDPHLLQNVTDSGDRDSTLSGAPAHTVAVAPDGSMWVKVSDSDNTWITVWEPNPTWQAVSLPSGFASVGPDPKARIMPNGQVFLRGRIGKVDSSLIVGVGGIAIGTVPSAAIPAQLGGFAGTASLGGDAMTGAGRVEIFPTGTSSGIGDDGSIVWWSQDGSQDSGTVGVSWVDISGNYWLD
jgi:hypothetical protein